MVRLETGLTVASACPLFRAAYFVAFKMKPSLNLSPHIISVCPAPLREHNIKSAFRWIMRLCRRFVPRNDGFGYKQFLRLKKWLSLFDLAQPSNIAPD